VFGAEYRVGVLDDFSDPFTRGASRTASVSLRANVQAGQDRKLFPHLTFAGQALASKV
jgi:hypothetical protein